VYNNAPYGYGATFYVQAGQVLSGQLYGNAPDGDSIAAILDTGPVHGTLELHQDGTFTYTAEENYLGTDSFSYVWSDGISESAVLTVTLVIHNGESPVAFDAHLSVLHDRTVSSMLEGYDADGDSLTAALVSGPAHGTVDFVDPEHGVFVYAPNPGYVGPDTFTYEWTDGVNRSNVATVTIRVYNNPPMAQGEWFIVEPGQTFAVFLGDSIPADYQGPAITLATLLENDWDPDGDALELVKTGQLSEHWEFDSSWNAWVFRPPADYEGIDGSFEYFVTDRIPIRPPYPPYNDTYNEDEAYPYSASWHVRMLLQVGAGGGGGGGGAINMYFAAYERSENGWSFYSRTNTLKLSGLEGPSAFERVNDKVVLRNDYVRRDPKKFILRINDPAANITPGPGNDQITALIVTFDKEGRLLDNGNEIVLREKPDAEGEFWSDELLLVAHPDDDLLNIPVADNQKGDPTFLGELEGKVRAIYKGRWWVDADVPAQYSLRVKSVFINWQHPAPIDGIYYQWTEANLREARYILAPLGIRLDVIGERTDVKPPPPQVNLNDADGLDDLSFEFDSQNKMVPNGSGELHNLLISYREQDAKVVHVYTVNVFRSTLLGVFGFPVVGQAFTQEGMSNPRLANSIILAGLISTDPQRRAFEEGRLIEYPKYTAVLAHELVHVLLNSPVGVDDHVDPKVGINAVNAMQTGREDIFDKDFDPRRVDYPRRIFPDQQQQILKSNLLTRLGQ